MITIAINTFWGGFITCLVVEFILLVAAAIRQVLKDKAGR